MADLSVNHLDPLAKLFPLYLPKYSKHLHKILNMYNNVRYEQNHFDQLVLFRLIISNHFFCLTHFHSLY